MDMDVPGWRNSWKPWFISRFIRVVSQLQLSVHPDYFIPQKKVQDARWVLISLSQVDVDWNLITSTNTLPFYFGTQNLWLVWKDWFLITSFHWLFPTYVTTHLNCKVIFKAYILQMNIGRLQKDPLPDMKVETRVASIQIWYKPSWKIGFCESPLIVWRTETHVINDLTSWC